MVGSEVMVGGVVVVSVGGVVDVVTSVGWVVEVGTGRGGGAITGRSMVKPWQAGLAVKFARASVVHRVFRLVFSLARSQSRFVRSTASWSPAPPFRAATAAS
jgi:hypothetical protein